jgi:hypothetical protein
MNRSEKMLELAALFSRAAVHRSSSETLSQEDQQRIVDFRRLNRELLQRNWKDANEKDFSPHQ